MAISLNPTQLAPMEPSKSASIVQQRAPSPVGVSSAPSSIQATPSEPPALKRSQSLYLKFDTVRNFANHIDAMKKA